MKLAQCAVWIVGSGLLLAAGVAAETEYETQQKTLKAKGASTTAIETKLNTQALERKLDQILANQQAIQLKLEEMAEELRIIKIRATR